MPKKSKPNKQKYGYTPPPTSIFYRRSQASQKGWQTRKSNQQYYTEEQKQVRREISRKGYATRTGIEYAPEIIPKYGVPSFISEKFEPSSARFEAKRLREEYESDLRNYRKSTKGEIRTQEWAKNLRDRWEHEYWEDREVQEQELWRTDWESNYLPTNDDVTKARNSIQWVGNKEVERILTEQALNKFNEEEPQIRFEEYLKSYALQYADSVSETVGIEQYSAWIDTQMRMGNIRTFEDLIEFVNQRQDIHKLFSYEELYEMYKGIKRDIEQENRQESEPEPEPWIGYDSSYYDEDEYDGSDVGDYEEDNILARIEEMLEEFDGSSLNVTPELQKIKEQDRDRMRSVLEGAIARDGRSAVARRLANAGEAIIYTVSDVLSTSGDAVVELEINTGKHNGLGTKVVQFNDIVNGGALSQNESAKWTRISENMNEGE